MCIFNFHELLLSWYTFFQIDTLCQSFQFEGVTFIGKDISQKRQKHKKN
jgi:hypothetical protein